MAVALVLVLVLCPVLLCATPLPVLPSLRKSDAITASGISSGIAKSWLIYKYILCICAKEGECWEFMDLNSRCLHGASIAYRFQRQSKWHRIDSGENHCYVFGLAHELVCCDCREGHSSVQAIHHKALSKLKLRAWKHRTTSTLIRSSRWKFSFVRTGRY